jgi:hypothetical protein
LELAFQEMNFAATRFKTIKKETMKTLNILLVVISLVWSESALAVREAADEVGIVVQGGITHGQTLRFDIAANNTWNGPNRLQLIVLDSQGNIVISFVFPPRNINGTGIYPSFFDVNADNQQLPLAFGDGNGRAQLTGIVRAVDPNNSNKPKDNVTCGVVASGEIFDNNTGKTLVNIPGLSLLACHGSFTTNAFSLTVSKTGTGTGRVASSPAGIDCGTVCQASYDSGTVVTLSAAADAGSTFVSWSGACTGSGACTVNMTSAQSVTATFNAR